MWAWTLLYFLLTTLLEVVGAVFSSVSENAAGFVYIAHFLAIFIIFPMYANAIYHRHVIARIQKAENFSSNREIRLQKLTAEGGTSSPLIIILVLVFILIIGILAAIAVPAYQDYTLRAKVAEGLLIAEKYKQGVEAYAIQHGRWPSSNADIGFTQQEDSANIASISVDESGVVIITYTNGPQLNGKSVAMTPSVNDENYIIWDCKGVNIESKHLPPACRKETVCECSRRPTNRRLLRLLYHGKQLRLVPMTF